MDNNLKKNCTETPGGSPCCTLGLMYSENEYLYCLISKFPSIACALYLTKLFFLLYTRTSEHNNQLLLKKLAVKGADYAIFAFQTLYANEAKICQAKGFIYLFIYLLIYLFIYLFIYFCLFRATPVAYGSSQARVQIGPMSQPRQCQIPAMSSTYTTDHSDT